MGPVITRRRILIGSGAAGAAALAGGVWVATSNPTELLFQYYQRLLPGVTLDPTSTRAAINDFLAVSISPLKLHGVATAWHTVGVGALSRANQHFELFTRAACSYFLINSNFFQLDNPRAETIIYTKPVLGAACGNPFADLSPP